MYYISYSIHSFFFFKQKTAYEMRISDWSSDVCSSDLFKGASAAGLPRQRDSNRTIASPNPAPRYSRPAISQGEIPPSSSLAMGVLTPNSAAEPRAKPMPV